ncbi:TolC family protein [Chitinophaga nivalis]|uniref:TolC family protein n=1 Tax=Chitinophaga nivalis TaxID=2991709 RepID=A0ABT3IU35_9BACT|nr:TolC family protein [Chitinophaga nivalis]MCW3462822.1 TolC family protein [Chitinophaga nivalis]MCW3487488.1 TolC family protein [Chitinophaga nivalis]
MKRYLLKYCLYSLLLMGSATGLQAQQQVLTLEQAIDLTLKNNFDIRLARNTAEVSANDYAYANFAFAPRLNATAGTTWNNTATKQEFANGSKRDTSGIKGNNISANVTLSWTLFDGLKMFATRHKLESIRGLGELAIKNQVQNSIATVIGGYYNIVQQKQQLKALAEQMSISAERVKLSDGKFTTGLGPKTDLLQSKVDLNAQKALYIRQLTLIEQSKSLLNQLMAVPAGATGYEVTDSIPFNAGLSFAALQQTIANNNTAIKVQQQNVAVSALTIKERQADYFPVISFNSGYNYNRNTSNAASNNFSPRFNRNGVFNYGLTANIPLFNGFNVKRQVQNARLDFDYQNIALDNIRSQVDLSLNNAFKDYEYYKKALELEEETNELAKENMMVALERFKQGVSTTLEVKEAQQSLEQSYYRLIQARYNTKLAETELGRLNGSLVQ